MIPSNRDDFMWMIGLLEGEGCFGIATSRGYSHVRIHVGMTDKDVVDRLKNISGGWVLYCRSKEPKHKDQWRWEITCKQARELMETMLPFMGERRKERITEVLKIDNKNRSRGRLTKHRKQEDVS